MTQITRSHKGHRRLIYLGPGDEPNSVMFSSPQGDILEVALAKVQRYRVIPKDEMRLQPETLVLRRDIPEDEWRGVVRRILDDGVEVEGPHGIEKVEGDLLISAEPPPFRLPKVKPGRVSNDPLAEEINQRVYEDRDPDVRTPSRKGEPRYEHGVCENCGTVWKRLVKSGQPRKYCSASCRAAASKRLLSETRDVK